MAVDVDQLRGLLEDERQPLEENSENVLSSIDGALERIGAGTYGACLNCGTPIAEDRLAAIPWATHCIDCKRLEERG